MFSDDDNNTFYRISPLATGPDPINNFSAQIYATLVFKHSDWLKYFEQPIRLLKIKEYFERKFTLKISLQDVSVQGSVKLCSKYSLQGRARHSEKRLDCSNDIQVGKNILKVGTSSSSCSCYSFMTILAFSVVEFVTVQNFSFPVLRDSHHIFKGPIKFQIRDIFIGWKKKAKEREVDTVGIIEIIALFNSIEIEINQRQNVSFGQAGMIR